ncbi:unnamed protein product [Cylindrotheca closterium]|uniref:Uncharacterized protein n=1 Tax=Cylindrotheca closterium TaxID=2856 RepID=A0AAD2CLM9_9STRA|nr:unnamed protein product [Cylindrotheca closterium]
MMLLNETRPTMATLSSPSRPRMMSFKRSNDQASRRIRSRYLHKLGVVDSSSSGSGSMSCDDEFSVETTASMDTLQTKGSPERKHVRRTSRPDEIQFEALKGSDGEDENDLSGPHMLRTLSLASETSTSSSVSFEQYVVVHPIPNLDAYSEDMKQAIWTNQEEAEIEVMRNYLEFASEGMQWQNTLEEEDFFEYNNELVHPVHIMNRHCSLKQNFLMGMSARRAYE